MTTVSTRVLKDQLSSYLHRAERGERIVVLRDGRAVAALVALTDVREDDEETRLATLAAQGLVLEPREKHREAARRPLVPSRGKPASAMVIEDRG